MFSNAVALLRSAAAELAAVLSPDHPRTLSATLNLAVCLADAGDLEAAAPLMALAAGGMARVLGPDHPDTLRCQANAAIIEQRRGGDGPAAELLDRLTRRLGDAHPAVEVLRAGNLLRKVIDPHPF